MTRYEENKNRWELAILTDEEHEQIQQIEKQLGIALIAYNDTGNPYSSKSSKDI
jgi:hypothetical protein